MRSEMWRHGGHVLVMSLSLTALRGTCSVGSQGLLLINMFVICEAAFLLFGKYNRWEWMFSYFSIPK